MVSRHCCVLCVFYEGACVGRAKSAQGTWGLGYTSGEKLYFTWDIVEEKGLPKE